MYVVSDKDKRESDENEAEAEAEERGNVNPGSGKLCWIHHMRVTCDMYVPIHVNEKGTRQVWFSDCCVCLFIIITIIIIIVFFLLCFCVCVYSEWVSECVIWHSVLVLLLLIIRIMWNIYYDGLVLLLFIVFCFFVC